VNRRTKKESGQTVLPTTRNRSPKRLIVHVEPKNGIMALYKFRNIIIIIIIIIDCFLYKTMNCIVVAVG